MLRLGLDFVIQNVGAGRQAYASAQDASLGQRADEDGCKNTQSAFMSQIREWK